MKWEFDEDVRYVHKSHGRATSGTSQPPSGLFRESGLPGNQVDPRGPQLGLHDRVQPRQGSPGLVFSAGHPQHQQPAGRGGGSASVSGPALVLQVPDLRCGLLGLPQLARPHEVLLPLLRHVQLVQRQVQRSRPGRISGSF